MIETNVIGLGPFIKEYPGMTIAPTRDSSTALVGQFKFSAQLKGDIEIMDTYHLQIIVPDSFPRSVPEVKELDHKIPRDGNHHVNPDDTLCLGSRLRLMHEISKEPDLIGFSKRCLIPYLYAITYKQEYGKFPFGELAHGLRGIVDDYLDLFGLKNPSQLIKALELLGMKRRIANKKPCPCGCGLRLGKCQFNRRLNKFRSLASRSWFKSHARNPENSI